MAFGNQECGCVALGALWALRVEPGRHKEEADRIQQRIVGCQGRRSGPIIGDQGNGGLFFERAGACLPDRRQDCEGQEEARNASVATAKHGPTPVMDPGEYFHCNR